MLPWEGLIQCLISGILMGGVYILIGVGLALIVGVMDVVNFAQGELLMIGMYTCYWLILLWRTNFVLVLIAAGGILFLIGMGMYRFFLEPLIEKGHMTQAILTFGLVLVFQSTVQLLWSARYRSLVLVMGISPIWLGPVSLPSQRVVAFVVALFLTGIMYIFLKKTFIGQAIQATAQNKLAAQLMGVNVQNIFMISFSIGAAFAGIAGALLATYYPIFPTAGFDLLILTITVITLGGMGSYEGSVIAGLLIGIYESLFAFYVSQAYRMVAIFVLFLFLLLFMPKGLMGERT